MYCVKCGVRLQENVGACPLCGTPVWDPEGTMTGAGEKRNYPDNLPRHDRESNLAAAAALTTLCALVVIVALVVCFQLYGELRWGGYLIGAVALFYVVAVLPGWFRYPRGEIFVPVDHAAAAVFVHYICWRTGGSWFLSFALPIIGASCLLSEAMICLLKYVRGGKPFIFGGFLLLLGGFTVLVEFFEHISFGTRMFRWSLFSLAGFGTVGLFLLIAGMIRPLRQALARRFFY